MGARQSRRSVDITTTPKKEGLPAEGVVGDAAAPGDGKLEKIEEADAKPTTNGVAPHTDDTSEDKDKDKDEATEKEKEKDDSPKVDEAKVESPTTETPAEGAAEVTTPTEGTPASPTTATSPESKETKKKDKPKKKWSFRSISFGKKDKNKPVREDTPKNGDVAKETLAEGGEEAETAAAASSPADDKSSVSTPTDKEQSETVAAAETPASATVVKAEDDKTTAAVPVIADSAVAAAAASPVEEKKEESSTPAPTPVPVDANKTEDIEKEVKSANADKTVEVSPVQAVIEAPVEVNSQSKPCATTTTATTATTTAPSIIERKTSEDFPSQFPSSPPPTPIDPSPLQQAQQVGANASAIAEALKLPAEAANKADVANASGRSVSNALPGSPTSSWRVETNSNSLDNEKSVEKFPTTVIPEQTGNAAPLIPVSVTDYIGKPVAESQKFDVELTEIVEPRVAVKSESCVANEKKVIEEISKIRDSVDDMVIQTEEGPVPVSGDIVFEAKPAVVVPDCSVEDIKLVDVPTSTDVNNANEENLISENVESSMDDLIMTKNESSDFSKTLDEPIAPLDITNDEDNLEKDLPPPPLPASSVPVPKATSQLLNFMSTQIEDTPIAVDEIVASDAVRSIEENSLGLPSRGLRIPEIEAENEVELADESQSQDHEQTDTSFSLPPPEDIPESQIDRLVEPVDETFVTPVTREIFEEDSSCQSPIDNARDTDNTINSEISEATASPAASSPRIPTDTTLLTPPRSPSPAAAAATINDAVVPTIVSSQLDISDDPINLEFKTESVEDSLNSYNDSELELHDRLAETSNDNIPVSCHLTNAVPENDQSKVETPVENIIANDIGTMETNDDAPKSPPPAVPVEAPAPTLGPAITEDVASVTKAIEEIDINEKAVAAAVNENIESANTNEIITEMNHQNNMNE